MNHRTLRSRSAVLVALLLAACGNKAGVQLVQDQEQVATTDLTASDGSGFPIASGFKSEFCLDIGGNLPNNGTAVQIYRCNGSNAQKWTFDNGLIRASDNRCLNVKDGGTGNNVRLQIWSCNAGDKNFIFNITGGTIRWKANGKCIDVTDGNFNNENPVQLYDCFTNSDNQKWDTSKLTGGQGTKVTTPSTPTNTSPASGQSGSTPNNGRAASNVLPGFVDNAYIVTWDKMTQQKQAQGAYNNEQQEYTNNGSNISYENDMLVITARPKGDNYGWTSAKMVLPNLGTSRGYIEASMNNPGAQGTWPAFWLMTSTGQPPWPQGGEIDIMEQVNGQPTQNVSTHYGPSPSQTIDSHITSSLPGMSGNFHRYGLAWDTSHCTFYTDGKKGSTYWYPAGSPFGRDTPGYGPMLNLAMGGMWPGYAADSIGPQRLVVKYVAQSASTPADF